MKMKRVHSVKYQLNRPWAWLAVLAVILRVIGLDKCIWLDKVYFLVNTVRHRLGEIVAAFPGDTQHPLDSILAQLSVVAFAEHVWSLRLPEVTFGTLSMIGFAIAILILVQEVVVVPCWIVAAPQAGFASSNAGLAPLLSVILAAVLTAASAFSLVRNYRYPKQDFEGEIQFVEAERQAGNLVVTAAATTFPILKYDAKPWSAVEAIDRLRAICSRDRPVWGSYTFPRYLGIWSLPLAKMIRKEFEVVIVFPGTAGNRQIDVARGDA